LSFGAVLGKLIAGESLSPDEVRGAFDAIFAGAWTPVQVGAFALALRIRGESAETIVAAAQAMRSAMTAVDHGLDHVVDTCGTGGDGASSVNISSAAAIVVAACGFSVAKHGNRSVSSRSGSADVVEALGIPIDLPPARQADVLREAKIAFLFAPAHHPALKHAALARRELGTRTIFNALGPLGNPARATHQLVGVYDDRLRAIAARALGELGVVRAWIVRGEDGLDEVSSYGPTRVSELRATGEIVERVVVPEDFGIARSERASIAGGDARANADVIERILDGHPEPARDAVVLNAAAALVVASGDDLRVCAERARAVLDDGTARGVLERWRKVVLRVRAAS
jgi:anthranilate phosphoribosyltransferase